MEGASAGAVNDVDCFCYNLKHKIHWKRELRKDNVMFYKLILMLNVKPEQT
jgi:hypothetical protein